MTLNKKLLAAAIAGLLFSANAGAVILGTDDARVYASELKAPVDLSADANDDLQFTLGYNFSPGEVRYGRVECTGEMSTDNLVATEADGNVDLGVPNEGPSGLFFSLTADDALATTTDTDLITIDADITLEDGGDIDCEFSIYDQPSQAQAGGSAGRIYTTGFQPFIKRASGFVFEMDPNGPSQTVADVEAPDGAYFDFVGGFPIFGNLTVIEATDVLNADGSQILVPDIFDPTSTVTVDGDFSAVEPILGPGDDATFSYADSFDDTSATWDLADTIGHGQLYYFPSGTAPIKASEYTATLNAVANAGFVVSDVGPIHVGEIVRNGTQLQAPLVQLPTDWQSRIALTNTGTIARPYEISLIGETGVTFTTDAAKLTGTIPAKGTKVVDLNEVITGFSAGSRGTINVNVSAPNTQIQGLYQIVNPTAGSISNHVMVRPGTN